MTEARVEYVLSFESEATALDAARLLFPQDPHLPTVTSFAQYFVALDEEGPFVTGVFRPSAEMMQAAGLAPSAEQLTALSSLGGLRVALAVVGGETWLDEGGAPYLYDRFRVNALVRGDAMILAMVDAVLRLQLAAVLLDDATVSTRRGQVLRFA